MSEAAPAAAPVHGNKSLLFAAAETVSYFLRPPRPICLAEG